MKSKGGITHYLDLPSDDGNTTRIAVLTIHKEELENLANFGDIIFVDGTHSALKMKWEILPLTLITKDYNITCGGILYAAIVNEQVIEWMLQKLTGYEEFRKSIQTFITDEDHSFKSTIKTWLKEVNSIPNLNNHINVNHVLCAMHKSRNFAKKLHEVEEQHSNLIEYYQIMILIAK